MTFIHSLCDFVSFNVCVSQGVAIKEMYNIIKFSDHNVSLLWYEDGNYCYRHAISLVHLFSHNMHGSIEHKYNIFVKTSKYKKKNIKIITFVKIT
jgi:hypothetical protein